MAEKAWISKGFSKMCRTAINGFWRKAGYLELFLQKERFSFDRLPDFNVFAISSPKNRNA
ncbi:hypothetical protein J18TS1_05700 [Oceanobacillus oncorhynchi subsp. incaldanensis]|nr:hypothetical protein J18TS1_05700 [Oceanobacillus oncorhynchi subsp. incaldanensis]